MLIQGQINAGFFMARRKRSKEVITFMSWNFPIIRNIDGNSDSPPLRNMSWFPLLPKREPLCKSATNTFSGKTSFSKCVPEKRWGATHHLRMFFLKISGIRTHCLMHVFYPLQETFHAIFRKQDGHSADVVRRNKKRVCPSDHTDVRW